MAPSDAIPMVVVRSCASGLISLPCWVAWVPHNSEAIAADLWRRAAAANDALPGLMEALRERGLL
jgi:hypothetical protein